MYDDLKPIQDKTPAIQGKVFDIINRAIEQGYEGGDIKVLLETALTALK
ncbi:MAG: hypothetical protein FWG05_05010 [Kiritimatiellaeota bacterium]|nr:hypothetical protein [Kiritimatiellota bacterium]